MPNYDDGYDARLTAGMLIADRLAAALGYDCAEAACEALGVPVPDTEVERFAPETP